MLLSYVGKRVLSAFKWALTEQAHAPLNLYTSPLMETCSRAADVFVSVDSVKMGEAHLLFGSDLFIDCVATV